MKELRINLAQVIEVPDDAEIWYAPGGTTPGFRLADGRLLRPQIVFELEEKRPGGDEVYRDLTYDELQALEVDTNDLVEVDIR